MTTYTFGKDFEDMYLKLLGDLAHYGDRVDTGHWQAQKGVPQVQSIELRNTTLVMDVPRLPIDLVAYVSPNMPWAEEHFAERVGGQPLNPPPSHENWPFAQKSNDQHRKHEQFSHTYPERLWPRLAGKDGERGAHLISHKATTSRPFGPLDTERKTYGDNYGIRYRYGDLQDAIYLLGDEPYTRQCYVPIWFPEDLAAAAAHSERVPCTLGYHFMRRRNLLHTFYPIRSCDVLRHLRDDLYMAGRLCQWMIMRLREEHTEWEDVVPGDLTLFVPSLHIFEGDLQILKHKYGVQL